MSLLLTERGAARGPKHPKTAITNPQAERIRDPLEVYETAADKIQNVYPSLPRPLLLSVLANVSNDEVKAVQILDQLMKLQKDKHLNGINISQNKRPREQTGAEETTLEDETRAFFTRHIDLPHDLVTMIFNEASGPDKLHLADIALEKYRHEFKGGYLTGGDTSSPDRSVVHQHSAVRNALVLHLIKIEEENRAEDNLDKKFEKIKSCIVDYEQKLGTLKPPAGVEKCLARCVLSQNQKYDKLLLQREEEREVFNRERHEAAKRQEYLIGAIKQLQARVEAEERGNTLFFNRFGGPPHGSAF